MTVSCDAYVGLDLSATDLTGTISETLDAATEDPGDESTANAGNCCTGTNTNEKIQINSVICSGDDVQPNRFSYDYTPNGDTNDGRNVWESESGGEYVWYSSDIESWIIGPTVGDLTAAAVVQGSLGYCPHTKKANVYVYSSSVSSLILIFLLFRSFFDCFNSI